MPTTDAKVNDPIQAFLDMQSVWKLPDALMGGTPAMREAAEDYLPREEAESYAAWVGRVSRSYLFNAYGDTVKRLAGRAFSEPVRLEDGSDKSLEELTDDIDLQGNDLTSFSIPVFQDGIDRGLTHILIDFPTTEPGLTLAQERSRGVRPFWTHVPATRVIGWRSERFEGEEVLTQLRILEEAVEPDGEYGEKAVSRVKVYRRTLPSEDDDGSVVWTLYEKRDGQSEYEQIDSGEVTIGFIPLVTFYVQRTGYMTGEPAMLDLAWKNLEHYQSSSDQRNILRFARMPLLFGAGFRKTELEGRVEIGSARMIRSSNKEATLKYVEHTGKAIESGKADLVKLEEQMVVLGLQPLLTHRPGNLTATAKAIDTAEESSELQSWIREFERTLVWAFQVTLTWMDRPGAPVGVDVSEQFASVMSEGELELLLKLRAMGDLSRESLYSELKKRGVLDESFDPVTEEAKLAMEGAMAGDEGEGDEPEFGGGGGEGDEGDEGDEE